MIAYFKTRCRIRHRIRCGFLFCCLGFALGIAFTAHADSTRLGTVKKVFDGDTVELVSGERVRLLGIDTPEGNLNNKKISAQPFYLESRKALMALVNKKRITLRTSETLFDRYGRTLAYLYLPDGTDVQLKMLRGGYAMMTSYPPNLGHLEKYAQAESEAQKNRIGMWNDPYFAVLPLAHGVPRKDGPVRISGIITAVSLNGRRIEIVVSQKLTLRIYHAAWNQFWRGVNAHEWIGKSVIAQGRLRSKSKTMGITHPIMLKIGAVVAQ